MTIAGLLLAFLTGVWFTLWWKLLLDTAEETPPGYEKEWRDVEHLFGGHQ